MSEDKPKTATEQALENAKLEIKEKLEQINILKELLDTEKHLRKETEDNWQTSKSVIEKVKKWASDFGINPDADYKGSFINDEIKKVLKEKKNVKQSS